MVDPDTSLFDLRKDQSDFIILHKIPLHHEGWVFVGEKMLSTFTCTVD